MTKPITDRPLLQAARVPKPYNEEIAAEICRRLSQGESLRAICEDKHMPSNQMIYRWMADEPTFRSAYARAREAQMNKWADDIVEIADEAATASGERIDKEGKVETIVDPGAVQAARLRIDTRKFIMSKLAAKTYGDKVDVNVSGTVEVSALSDEELEARTRARLVDLGVQVAGPLLVALPGTARASVPSPEPEPVDVVGAVTARVVRRASTRKKSANDLLGLVV